MADQSPKSYVTPSTKMFINIIISSKNDAKDMSLNLSDNDFQLSDFILEECHIARTPNEVNTQSEGVPT